MTAIFFTDEHFELIAPKTFALTEKGVALEKSILGDAAKGEYAEDFYFTGPDSIGHFNAFLRIFKSTAFIDGFNESETDNQKIHIGFDIDKTHEKNDLAANIAGLDKALDDVATATFSGVSLLLFLSKKNSQSATEISSEKNFQDQENFLSAVEQNNIKVKQNNIKLAAAKKQRPISITDLRGAASAKSSPSSSKVTTRPVSPYSYSQDENSVIKANSARSSSALAQKHNGNPAITTSSSNVATKSRYLTAQDTNHSTAIAKVNAGPRELAEDNDYEIMLSLTSSPSSATSNDSFIIPTSQSPVMPNLPTASAATRKQFTSRIPVPTKKLPTASVEPKKTTPQTENSASLLVKNANPQQSSTASTSINRTSPTTSKTDKAPFKIPLRIVPSAKAPFKIPLRIVPSDAELPRKEAARRVAETRNNYASRGTIAKPTTPTAPKVDSRDLKTPPAKPLFAGSKTATIKTNPSQNISGTQTDAKTYADIATQTDDVKASKRQHTALSYSRRDSSVDSTTKSTAQDGIPGLQRSQSYTTSQEKPIAIESGKPRTAADPKKLKASSAEKLQPQQHATETSV